MILRDYITAILALAILLGGAYVYKRAKFIQVEAHDEQKRRFIYACEKYGEVRVSSRRVIKCSVVADKAMIELF